MRRFDNCLNGREPSQAKWARRIPLRIAEAGREPIPLLGDQHEAPVAIRKCRDMDLYSIM